MAENLGASFTLDVANLKAGLAQANRLIRESESEFKAAAAGMDDWRKSQEGLEARIKYLNKTQDIQKQKVEALKKQYEEAGYASDDMSAAAIKLRTDINREQAALNKTEKELRDQIKALEDLSDASDDASDEVEDLGDEAEKSGEGFTVAKGAIAGFISNGLSAVVGACKNAVSSLAGLAEETREYRENLSKLQTAFAAAGKSTELATKTYKDFYAVLGEEDRSIEAVNHLAKFVDTEEDMAKWTKICTGVWGTFGDSLPIEGLTEAANETIRTGELTGVLTDALNWASKAGETFGVKLKANTKANEEYNKTVNDAKSAEDFFKIALSELSTEQERAAFITETLNGLYSDAANKYEENSASVMEARRANSDYADSMAELGAELEPVNLAVAKMKTQFVSGLTPALKKQVIPAAKDFFKTLSTGGTVEKFSKSLANIAQKVLPPLSKAVKFVAENIETLGKVAIIAVTAFTALNATMKIMTAVKAATTAISGLSAGIGIATKVQVAWNAAMSANPIGAVITAVALLVGGIALLATTQKEATKATEVLTKEQLEAIDAANEAAESFREERAASAEMAKANIAQVNHAVQLTAEFQNLVDANGEVRKGEEARAQFILNELNNALGTEYKQISEIVDKNGKLKDSIYKVIEAKKAQILLSAYENTYAEAVKNVAKEEAARADIYNAILELQDKLAKKTPELEEAQARLDAAMKSGSVNELQEATNRRYAIFEEIEALKNSIAEKQAAYKTAEQNVKESYAAIDAYSSASTASLAGDTEEAIRILTNYGRGFKTAAETSKEGIEEQKRLLKEQYLQAKTILALMEKDYAETEQSMTDEQKRQAQQRIKDAKEQVNAARKEYQSVGGNMVEGMAEGFRDRAWSLSDAINSTINKAVRAAKQAAQIKSPSRLFRNAVGKYIGLGIAAGVDDTTNDVVKSVKNQVKSAADVLDAQAASAHINASFSSAGNAAGSQGGKGEQIVINQTNNYAEEHSRLELYKSKQATVAAVRLAMGEA